MVNIGDINVNYRIYGEGESLIMIMGYGSTMNLWEQQLIDSLSKSYQVIIFDNRGMGETTAGEKVFGIEQFADDTAALMVALQIDQAHLLGWSMGSYIAQELALRYPEKVNKLILYASLCNPEMYPPASEVMDTLGDPSGTPQEQGARWISLLFPETWLKNDTNRLKEIFYRPMGSINPENIQKQGLAIDQWPGTCDRLSAILNETLLISGAEDVLVPVENSKYLLSKMPHATISIIPAAGHGLMFQEPEQFGQVILEFLG